jgi:putative MATE family efflux protein
MGTMDIHRLLITLSVPMMTSMAVQALYNIVDSIYVSHIDTKALAAVSLAFPLQSLMHAFMNGTCIGVNSYLSRSLGAKDYSAVRKTAAHGIMLCIFAWLMFIGVGLGFGATYFKALTNDPQIIQYGITYVQIVLPFSIGSFLAMMTERMLASTGNTFYAMIAQVSGAVTNTILDPLLIFGLLGFPKMGMAGAAIATVIAQSLAAVISLYFNFTRNKDIDLSFKGFRVDFHIIKKIYQVGLPSMLMNSVDSFMFYSMNKILIGFSTVATTIFGVYYKLQSFFFLPVYGVNYGMIPIIGYNYGARNGKRVLDTVHIAIRYAMVFMTLGFAVFMLFPDKMLTLFNADGEMIKVGSVALRIISTHFLLAGFCIIFLAVFQAIGNGTLSMVATAMKHLLFRLPSAYFLASFGDVNLVWWCWLISEAGSLLFCSIFYFHIVKKEMKSFPLPQTAES